MICLSGLMAATNFAEFYKIKILKRLENYPFGFEGPVPYYYKSERMYATFMLFSGTIFLCILIFGSYSLIKGFRKRVYVAFSLTLLLILVILINSKIN